MRVSLQLPYFNPPPDQLGRKLADIARFADDQGFYSLWVMDHFFQMEMLGKSEDPMLEGYTMLGYFAALTERIHLGALVTGVIYRAPGLLIKEVTTLDVLSGGRMYLGIGAAWYEREHRGLGIPFPPFATGLAVEPMRRLGLVDLPAELVTLLTYGRGIDNRRFKEAGFDYRYTTAGAVEAFVQALRLRNTVGGPDLGYRYEEDVEKFFRHSPAVLRDRPSD